MNTLCLIWRFFEIVFFVAVHTVILALRLTIWLIGGRAKARLSLLGESFARLLESLGATFIKIGQILSSRPDLLPPEIIAPLARLQDETKPFSARKIPKIIRKEFGQSMGDLFAAFDFNPLSSASVAQVHRARLKQGTEVAIKIRRPGLIRRVRDDLLLLNYFIRLLNLLPAMRLIPLGGLAAEFGGAIEKQLDFRIEAENNRRFRKNFSKDANVKIPALIDDLCSQSVLAMEFIDNLTKVQALDLTERERENAAVVGLRALYKMIFVDGFIHGDMHPGNIFFRAGGEFVLLDLGLVAKLEGRDLKDFVEFFYGMATNNGKECARVAFETATFRAPHCDREKFEGAMIRLIDEHFSKDARDFEVTAFAAHLFDTQRRYGISGTTKFTMAIVSLVVFEGMVKRLHPGLDFQAEARKFIVTAWSRVFLNPSPRSLAAAR